VLRIVCPSCKLVFLRVEVLDVHETVTCPRCQTVFQPDEEELLDPEND
jgi:Zn-finger nucleic acid-binding protein